MSIQVPLPELNSWVQPLIDTDALREVSAGRPRKAYRHALVELKPQQICDPHTVKDPEMADCCHAALWLANHFLDESHAISQRIKRPAGSWWHGIMHRREGDFSNAKYWFRQVGSHGAMQTLGDRCEQMLGSESPISCWSEGSWDPMAYVDLCQQATREEATARWCGEIAYLEWATLFEYCYDRATLP